MFHVREAGIALYAFVVPEVFRIDKTGAVG